MIINIKARDARHYEQWARWFAWHPVRLDDSRIVWLEVVERIDAAPLNDAIVWRYRVPA